MGYHHVHENAHTSIRINNPCKINLQRMHWARATQRRGHFPSSFLFSSVFQYLSNRRLNSKSVTTYLAVYISCIILTSWICLTTVLNQPQGDEHTGPLAEVPDEHQGKIEDPASFNYACKSIKFMLQQHGGVVYRVGLQIAKISQTASFTHKKSSLDMILYLALDLGSFGCFWRVA